MIDFANLSPRDRRAVLLGLAVLAAILVICWVIAPWLSRWQRARGDHEAAAAQLAQTEMRLGGLLRQREELAKTYGPAVHKPLLRADQAALKFNDSVQNLLRNSGIAEPTCQPQTPRKMSRDSGVELLSMRVSGKCQLPQLANLLAQLPKADSLIVIDQITASTNEKQPGQVDLTLVLSTFALADGRRS